MKYFHDQIKFHFFDVSEPVPVRYVYDMRQRKITIADLEFDGVHHPLSEDQMADLEAGVLDHLKVISTSNELPDWAVPYTIKLSYPNDFLQETITIRLSDIVKQLEVATQRQTPLDLNPELARVLVGTIVAQSRLV